MDKAAAKAMVLARDVRLERLCRHNFGLARDIHPDRLAGLAWPDAAGWKRLLACPASVRTLSRDVGWLSPGLEAPGWIDLPRPRHRLGLLPCADQLRGLSWFAMAVRFLSVRRCIDGRQLRRLAEAGGREARNFVLERGNIMVGEKVRALFPGHSGAELADAVEWTAAAAWEGVMGDAPAGYVGRSRLLLPPRFEKRTRTLRPLDAEERRILWAGMRKILREALPQWVDFFS